MLKTFCIMMLSGTTAWAGLSKLQALSMIESGDNDAAVGQAGEVSRYQIKPWIWRGYSKSKSYCDARESTAVAIKYLSDLEGIFRRRAQREPTDFDLYVLWNAGPAYYARCGFSASRIDPVIRNRARRFDNLRRMENLKDREKSKPAPATAGIGQAESRSYVDRGQSPSAVGTARQAGSPSHPAGTSQAEFLTLLTPLPPVGESGLKAVPSSPPAVPMVLPTELPPILAIIGAVPGGPEIRP